MDELSVFISYRIDDAIDLARRIRNSLQGRSVYVSDGTIEVPKTISVFFDKTTPPVENWKVFFDAELNRASVLIVICSPGSCSEFEGDDYFYSEILWWIENKEKQVPIFVTPKGPRWIPKPLKQKWPDAQTIEINPAQYLPDGAGGELLLDGDVKRFLVGIADRIKSPNRTGNLIHVSGIQTNKSCSDNFLGLYSWEKNKAGLYTACNENYARAAGFDSPSGVLGKSDYDMPWRSLADFFRSGDQSVMNAEFPSRDHVQETEIMVDRVADILVTETQLITKNNECVGVQGYFIDLTNVELQPSRTINFPSTGLILGSDFDGVTLSEVECNVLRGMLRKFPVTKISVELGIGTSEVVSCVTSIMRKLQCNSLGDVLATAIRAGLPLAIFGIT